MKANEIKMSTKGYLFNANIYPAKSHYKFLMSLGRVFPTTKAQAMYFVRNKIRPDVYTLDDVLFVEKELAPYGFVGKYKYTKNRHWVRVVNIEDMYATLRAKYGF